VSHDELTGTLALTEWPQGTTLMMPGWYYEFGGNVVIRTPRTTSVAYKNGPGMFPFSPDGFPAIDYRNLPNESIRYWYDQRNPQLRPDRISFKRFGDEPEIYRVEWGEVP
jgi:hypothetical protein